MKSGRSAHSSFIIPTPSFRLGGEGGIRTREAFQPTAFRERHHQPLGHLSALHRTIASRFRYPLRMRLDVALVPRSCIEPESCVCIVVDALRATSTIAVLFG